MAAMNRRGWGWALAAAVTTAGWSTPARAQWCLSTQDIGCCKADNTCININQNQCPGPIVQPPKPGTVVVIGPPPAAPPQCQCAASGCCWGMRRCCMPDGSCTMSDGLCCLADGGTPGGPGSSCGGETVACCLSAGGTQCEDADTACCAGLGGVVDPNGALCAEEHCADVVACCKPDGADGDENPWCQNETSFTCAARHGTTDPFGGCDALLKNPNENDEDLDGVLDSCDNCEPDSAHHCDFFDCYNPGQEDEQQCIGSTWGFIECNGLCAVSGGECLGDGDGVGTACDNCPNMDNADQADADGDGRGDVCDNCPTHANGPALGLCVNGDPEIPTLCLEDADCGPGGVCSNDQEDCDNDGFCDVDLANEPNCDQDGLVDDCDGDIDGDGVDNGVDVCDYTPIELALLVETASGHPLRGTVPYDVDGDCDVDAADVSMVTNLAYGPGCASGTPALEVCACPATQNP